MNIKNIIIILILHSHLANSANSSYKVESGSFLTSLLNRSKLSHYSKKIKSQTITSKEIQDYIRKGGSLDNFSYYSMTKDFFVSAPQYSILNHFLMKGYTQNASPPKDRIKTLRILLASGSDPNHHVKDATFLANGYLAPVLQACAVEDKEALSLFMKYKANLNLVENIYTGLKGPCLSIATNNDFLNWLLSKGANINYKDPTGKNLLQLAVKKRQPIEKIKWLMRSGLSPNHKDNDGESAIDRVKSLIRNTNEIIKSVKYSKNNSGLSEEAKSDTIIKESKNLDRLNKVLTVLIK